MTTYGASDIVTLDEMTHIRTNPGMYIGEISNPTHLLEEALDNALDEVINGHADVIAVQIDTKKNVYSIFDNGRGIPLEDKVPVTISTKLFSGAKFKGQKKSYSICLGLHGVGLVAVNALSDLYEVEVYRDKKRGVFTFKNQRLKTSKIEDFTDKAPFATKISFHPDKTIFSSLDIDLVRIRKRLSLASAQIPKCSIVLNIDKKQEMINISEKDLFMKDCTSPADKLTQIGKFSTSVGEESCKVMFAYSLEGSMTPKIFSSVNLLNVDQGGNQILMIQDILKAYFASKAKKYHFQPTDCLNGLRAYVSLTLLQPEYSSQSKEKLVTPKAELAKKFSKLPDALYKYFEAKPKYLEELLESFQAYRKGLDAKKLKLQTTGSKRGSVKYTKLRDCSSRVGTLFVVEGQSAEGSLVQCRDPKIHAIFPLRGKIPSIVNHKDILKNKEIRELAQSLGTGVHPNFDMEKFRYQRVVCACDADADGYHIACLLTIALATLVPDILKNGHYHIAQTPLYAISNKNDFIPLWNQEELDKALEEKKNIIRLKGLGEMNGWQLKKALLDKDTRRWYQVSFSEDIEKLYKLFSDVNCKRELLQS